MGNTELSIPNRQIISNALSAQREAKKSMGKSASRVEVTNRLIANNQDTQIIGETSLQLPHDGYKDAYASGS